MELNMDVILMNKLFVFLGFKNIIGSPGGSPEEKKY